jgi:hypothetical protein
MCTNFGEGASSLPLLSFVIPVRRDDRVTGTVRRLQAWAVANRLAIELVIIGEQGARGVPPGVTWIERRPARKGRCVRDGVLASHGEVVLVADADLPVADDR